MSFKVPTVVRRLGWVSFFTDAGSEMIYPLLPALLRSFGAASVWLGAMEGVAEAASAFVKWRIGPVVDRAPKKKGLIVAGYGLATCARPVIALASAGWHVVLLRTLDRIGKGIRGVPRDTLVADSVAPENMARAFAFHRMMDNAGSVLGPILAFALLRGLELPLRTVIGLALVPGLVSVAVLVFGVHETKLSEPATSAPTETEAPDERLPPEVRKYLFVLALFTLGASADSFLVLRAVDIGMNPAWAPVLWLALSGAKAASNLPGGILADRVGNRATLVAAWLLYAAFYAAMPIATTPLAFGIIAVFYGVYYGLAEGSERALLASLSPKNVRGRAFGAMHAVTGLAVLPANLLFGALYEHHPAIAFRVSAGCAALAAVLLGVLVTKPARA